MGTDLKPTQWICEHCGQMAQTFDHRPHTEMHACRARSGLLMPLTRKGERVLVVAREDYVGSEKGLRYEGTTAVSAVTRQRGDGSNDLFVFPGQARLETDNG